MKILDDIKSIVTIASVIVAMVASSWGVKLQADRDRFRDNLYHKEIQYKDKENRLVTQVTELQFSRDELKQIAKADSSKLSNTQKELYKVAKELEVLGIKAKDVEAYNKAKLEVIYDSLVSKAELDSRGCIKALKPIKTDNLSLEFNVKTDSVLVDYKYTADVTTVLNRKPNKYTYKGTKRFFLARLVNPRYEYWSTNVVSDPNASIKSDVYINFGRFNK